MVHLVVLRGKEGIGYLAIGVFQTYFVIMALISQFYTFQLVIQEGMGIFKAMAHSVKLFLKFPAYTLGACFQAFCVAIPLMVTVVGFGFCLTACGPYTSIRLRIMY